MIWQQPWTALRIAGAENLSPEGRARLVAAVKARWAKVPASYGCSAARRPRCTGPPIYGPLR
jgi:hypothetical protein